MFQSIKALFGKADPAPAEPVLDFSHLDTNEKVLAAVDAGELVPILLFPEIFGGENVEMNTVYVPPEVRQIQNQMIGTIARFVEQELVDNLRVNPEYKGNSCVPCKIVMQTSKAGSAGRFNPIIDIW